MMQFRWIRVYGLVGIIGALVITGALWFLAKGNPGVILGRPFLSLGQITALLGFVLLCENFILSARFGFLESFFGGLDKMYKMHRLVGALGFVAICFHPVFLALNTVSFGNVLRYFFPSDNFAYTLGVFALYFFIVLIALTVYVKLPYHIWKISHRFMGIPLMLYVLHVFLIPSDTSRYVPLRIWILSLGAIALFSYFYKLVLYSRWGPRYSYFVSEVITNKDVTEIVLESTGKKFVFQPGQFVFVSFANIGVGREVHPFSVSSGPDDPYLRLSIKSLGDYTRRVSILRRGDKVNVYGPYGVFGQAAESKKNQLWIAGGIGVTPFLSLLRSRADKEASDVRFLYCTRDEKDAPYLSEIREQKKLCPALTFLHYQSEKFGRIDCYKIEQAVPDCKSRVMLLCGPRAMMEDLAEQFVALGVRPRNIIYEDFSFLT